MPGTIDGGTRKGRINVSYSYSRWCTSYLACCYWLDSYCCDSLSLYKKSAECSTRTKDSSYWYCFSNYDSWYDARNCSNCLPYKHECNCGDSSRSCSWVYICFYC